jgi:hypothetical protein
MPHMNCIPLPWPVDDLGHSCYIVRDANGYPLRLFRGRARPAIGGARDDARGGSAGRRQRRQAGGPFEAGHWGNARIASALRSRQCWLAQRDQM